MKVSRGSWLVKWAYLFSGRHVPTVTSLCAIFWRCVLLTPLVLFLIGLALFAILNLIWQKPLEIFIAVGSVASVIAVAVGIGHLAHKRRARRWQEEDEGIYRPESFLVQGARAVKSRICPLVEIE